MGDAQRRLGLHRGLDGVLELGGGRAGRTPSISTATPETVGAAKLVPFHSPAVPSRRSAETRWPGAATSTLSLPQFENDASVSLGVEAATHRMLSSGRARELPVGAVVVDPVVAGRHDEERVREALDRAAHASEPGPAMLMLIIRPPLRPR
jgi:hypothetical protein